MLTADEIRLILKAIGKKTVVPASRDFPYEIVSNQTFGYSDDPAIGALQAKLSVMLEVQARSFQNFMKKKG